MVKRYSQMKVVALFTMALANIQILAVPLRAQEPPAIASQSPELEKLTKSYLDRLGKETAGVHQEFERRLLVIEKRLAATSKLEAALAVREFRIARTLEPLDRAWMASPPKEPDVLAKSSRSYARSFYSKASHWDATYERELSLLERKFSAEGALEAAIEAKTERLRISQLRERYLDHRDRDDSLNLTTFLPGRVFTYQIGTGSPREIHFLEGETVFDYKRELFYAYSVSERELILSHETFSSEIVLEFDGDGLTFQGKTDQAAVVRSGKFVEKRKFSRGR